MQITLRFFVGQDRLRQGKNLLPETYWPILPSKNLWQQNVLFYGSILFLVVAIKMCKLHYAFYVGQDRLRQGKNVLPETDMLAYFAKEKFMATNILFYGSILFLVVAIKMCKLLYAFYVDQERIRQ